MRWLSTLCSSRGSKESENRSLNDCSMDCRHRSPSIVESGKWSLFPDTLNDGTRGG